jgi:streptomycin 6-kinase
VGWLDRLPAVVADVARRWSLTVGPPYRPGGHTAWVAPAESLQGRPLVLKVGWRHPESEQEADGLLLWGGDGAVMLHASTLGPDTVVLLLERCQPGRALSNEPEEDQDAVIAGLLRRLWIDPPASGGPRFRPLADMCARWADSFDAKRAEGRVVLSDTLVEEGLGWWHDLSVSADRTALLCTDLHAGNVLSARRQPWLAIDPKPYVGDPAYDAVQHLLNCPGRIRADPHGLVKRLARLLDLDPERLRLWLLARCVLESPDEPHLGVVAQQLAWRRHRSE